MVNFNRKKEIVKSFSNVENEIDATANVEEKIVTSFPDVENKIDVIADAKKKIVTSFPDLENEIDVTDDVEKKSVRWRRILLGTMFVSLGVAAISVGVASIKYRLTHLVVDGGIVNGQTVRLTAPRDGNLKAFYGRSGIKVKAGQLLARIESEVVDRGKYQRERQQNQLGLQLIEAQDKQIRQKLAQERLAGEVKFNEAELIAAKESLDFLKNQLLTLENQYQQVQAVDVNLATEVVKRKQAAVELAEAKATAARSDFQRFQKLQGKGAISQQKLEASRLTFQAAEAQIKENLAAFRSAQTVLDSVKRGVAVNSQQKGGTNFLQERSKLQQAIQKQQMNVNTLAAKVNSGRLQLNQTIALSKNPLPIATTKTPEKKQSNSRLHLVKAPFGGVVYTTHSEQGENVTNSEPIVTLLNCNNLWVETLVPRDIASRIDIQKPAKVKLLNTKETFSGEIDIIQPLNNTQNVTQQTNVEVKALSPMIPSHLVGKSLMRVKVTIPQTNASTQSQSFCGIGQSTEVTFSQK